MSATSSRPAAESLFARWKGAVAHCVLPALLVAGVVFFAHGVLASLDSVFATAVQGFVSTVVGTGGAAKPGLSELAIVKITEAEFHGSQFRAESPLSRCALHSHLTALLKQQPGLKTLAVDFDLSPTQRTDEVECRCEQKLSDWLAQEARSGRRVILLLPYEVPDEPSKERIAAWVKDMRDAGVLFGHGKLSRKHGFVAAYPSATTPAWSPSREADVLPLGQLLGQSLTGAKTDPGRHPEAESHDRPIAYFHLLKLAGEAADFSIANIGQLPPEVKHIIFGGGYAVEDRHETPIGLLDGVDVHAAIATDPDVVSSHALEFVLEFLLGAVLIGPVFHLLWQGYLDRRRAKPMHVCALNVFAFLRGLVMAWPIGLAALMFLLALSALGSFLAIAFGLWLNVAGLTVGMLIESLAGGSIGAAIHLAEQGSAGHPAAANSGGAKQDIQKSDQHLHPDTTP